GTKAPRSNQRSIVGLSSLPDAIRFGRLPVPVESMLCDWLTLKGRPERSNRIPLSCHPPMNLSASELAPPPINLPLPNGRSYVQLEVNVCLMSKSETARSRPKS